uniref:CMP-N-acetylneuraminate-beta-galactosamide-alpha-2,3-sialyltransferase 4 n=1 Tax=Leptobrachium leishanense TaxID=445787 RepID=A0A8C5Q9K0_9ANUR
MEPTIQYHVCLCQTENNPLSSSTLTLPPLCLPSYSRDHPVFLQLSDYFWVKNETLYQLPYGTKGSEDSLMKFLALTKRYNVRPEIERLPCKRCVVVGNGFRLKHSSLGNVIDKYDIVIRLNNAPVHNYQEDVGKKTTMRFFYPESADFNQHLDNNPDSLMVLVPFKPMDINWIRIIINDEKRVFKGFWKMPPIFWEVNSENVRILNPYFMDFAARKLLTPHQAWKSKRRIPTTGLLAITFALHFCDLVHIAGFGYPMLGNKQQPIHYYDRRTLMRTSHNITLEAIAIKQLLQHRLIHNLTYF